MVISRTELHRGDRRPQRERRIGLARRARRTDGRRGRHCAAASRAGDSLEILTSTALRERSLQIFDRAFAITYALEAIAVLIGLAGVSFAASSTALARRAEFGMLRHIGMLRQSSDRDARERRRADERVRRHLRPDAGRCAEPGAGVRRQSPVVQLEHRPRGAGVAAQRCFSVALIAAAAITAIWSGRAAMNQDAVRAVREDW